jgi:hypothetical protein
MSHDMEDESVQPLGAVPEPAAEATTAEKVRFLLANVVPRPPNQFYGFGLAGDMPDKLLPKIKGILGSTFAGNEAIVAGLGNGRIAILCTDRALYWGSKKTPARRVE